MHRRYGETVVYQCSVDSGQTERHLKKVSSIHHSSEKIGENFRERGCVAADKISDRVRGRVCEKSSYHYQFYLYGGPVADHLA